MEDVKDIVKKTTDCLSINDLKQLNEQEQNNNADSSDFVPPKSKRK